ncbi:MAG: hypothetical protein FJY82_06145 [Candidatus Aminicenantes bacterium]|nr:hypothetical protein [Candidatus Aminicenantes bacterium]
MNIRKYLGLTGKTAAFVLAVFGLAAAAADRPAPPQEAVALVYKFAQGAPLVYKQSSSQVQNIDVMGQMITTDVHSNMDITLTPKGLKEGNHLLGVTIEAMAVNVQGPQGGLSPDVSGIVGKSFDMVLSPRGEELDVSGASVLMLDMGDGGRRDLSSDFQGLFPNLPDKPVKIGESWPSRETIVQKSDAGEVRIVFENMNTLDGFETVDGLACARIKTAVKGVLSGALNQMGMSLGLDGKLEGTETSYFAVQEGLFVKSEAAADMNGVISAEAMGMTIPFTGSQRSAMALAKK